MFVCVIGFSHWVQSLSTIIYMKLAPKRANVIRYHLSNLVKFKFNLCPTERKSVQNLFNCCELDIFGYFNLILVWKFVKKLTMSYYVVLLECKKYFVAQEKWLQNAVVGFQTKMFYSENPDEVPDYDSEVLFHFQHINSVYSVFVCRRFGE